MIVKYFYFYVNKKKIISLTAISVIVFCVQVGISKAAGPTYIEPGADILTETIWSKEDSPYVVKARINVNAKLTIEPGTVVKFSTGLSDLNIKNDFFIKGTREDPVFFTSIHDDSDGNNSENSSKADHFLTSDVRKWKNWLCRGWRFIV